MPELELLNMDSTYQVGQELELLCVLGGSLRPSFMCWGVCEIDKS